MSCYKLNSIPAISQHSLKFQNTETLRARPTTTVPSFLITHHTQEMPSIFLQQSGNPWTGVFPIQGMFLEWLTPVPGLLPRVCRGTNCSLADACRNAKYSDSLHQGLALKSVRMFKLLRKQTLSSFFSFWDSWGLFSQSSQKPGSALDPESLGSAHQISITWP